jgi:DNA-binding transcriptional LysR family regulator
MHDPLTPEPFPSWDDFRFFLATSKAGSFSKAASQLGVTQPTISRRIESLEQSLGVRLFDRMPSGVTLTAQGQKILDTARYIEEAVLDIQRSVFGSDERLEGPVRISVSDGLAAFWMTPRLGQIQDAHPGIAIEFLCSIQPADVRQMESDLAIRSGRPEETDLVAVGLGTIHFVPWASQAYLDRFGTPGSPEELLQHRLVDHAIYYDDQGDWGAWFALARAANLISYRTNSSAAMLSAIQNGLGIGLLPTYSCDCVDGIVPIDLGLRTDSNLWLAYHPSIQGAARMRPVIDWVRGLFDPGVWPWFSEEFHPPKVPGGREYASAK